MNIEKGPARDRPNGYPLVSVIIPAYNAEKFILEALQSVVNQNYAPIEILLVDDGSTDGTVDLVRREVPQVRIIQQANGGVATARNAGLMAATGDYLCFLDADDGWFPGKLAAQVDYLEEHPEVGVSYHGWHVWKPDANGVFTLPKRSESPVLGEIDPTRSGWIYTHLLLDCIVHTSTVMMRRKVVESVGGFRTNLVIGEDYDYWIRVSRQYRYHKLTGIYSFYRSSPESLTALPKKENHEYNVVQSALNNWGLASPDEKSSVPRRSIQRRLAKMAFDFGYAHYRQGSKALAKEAFSKALSHEPWRGRALVYLILAHWMP